MEYPPFSDVSEAVLVLKCCCDVYMYVLQLVLFKLIGLIFPTSDFKHPVVTPAMLFMGQLLLKVAVIVNYIEHFANLFICLFVCGYSVKLEVSNICFVGCLCVRQ